MNLENSWQIRPIPSEILAAIKGKSYPADDKECLISPDRLAYLQILHYGFDQQIHEGRLICNRLIAYDLLDIFKLLFANRYQIEKVHLIDEYGADDEASMAVNNTSAFNYRVIWGTSRISNHAYGFAIDINPLYNPYISCHDGQEVIQPANSLPYVDRTRDFPHKIDHNDLCYRLFLDHGFSWGGDWTASRDYQHFEKVYIPH